MFPSELISNLVSQHFSQLVRVKAVREWVQRLFFLVNLRLQDNGHDDDDDGDDDNNKSEITAIQLTVENVEPRLRSVLHKVSSTIDRWSLFSTQNQPKSCF